MSAPTAEDYFSKAWDSGKHPRAQGGKFTSTGQSHLGRNLAIGGALALGSVAALTPGGRKVAVALGRQARHVWHVGQSNALAKNPEMKIGAFGEGAEFYPGEAHEPIDRLGFGKLIQYPVALHMDHLPGKRVLFHPQAYQHLQGDSLKSTLAKVEHHIKDKKVEHFFVIRPDGKIMAGSRGDDNATPVFFRKEWKNKGYVVTHNHPSDGAGHAHGEGQVLSTQDIRSAHLWGINHLRAVAEEGKVTHVVMKRPTSALAHYTTDLNTNRSVVSNWINEMENSPHYKNFWKESPPATSMAERLDRANTFVRKHPQGLATTALAQDTILRRIYQENHRKGIWKFHAGLYPGQMPNA